METFDLDYKQAVNYKIRNLLRWLIFNMIWCIFKNKFKKSRIPIFFNWLKAFPKKSEKTKQSWSQKRSTTASPKILQNVLSGIKWSYFHVLLSILSLEQLRITDTISSCLFVISNFSAFGNYGLSRIQLLVFKNKMKL